TEIGNEAEATRTRVKNKTDRIDRVMRDRKSLDGDIANRKLTTGAKDPPIAMPIQGVIAANRLGRKRVRVDRDLKFSAENFEPANMIAVFVSENNSVDLLGADA